jgi:arylsulfatase A-like enzyme
MTGLYPARIGITTPSCHVPEVQLEKRLAPATPQMRAINALSLTRLSPDYYTLAEALRDGGYETAHYGKWHLGHSGPYEPKDQGFGFDFPHTPNVPGPGPGYLAPWKFIKDPEISGQPGEHIEDRMSQEAARYIKSHADRPFYLNYWAFSVHSPWNARSEDVERFQSKVDPQNPQRNPLYAAMVKSLDDGVGRLLAAIDEAGVADRTIIVFFSDNGGYSYPPKATNPAGYEEIPATSNLPLRGGKGGLYEGGTREPCVVVWPGHINPATTSEVLLSSVDFYPTLLAMCGLKPRDGLTLDGVDQTPALLGKGPVREQVFCHFPHGTPNQSLHVPGSLPGTYVRRGDWKLLRFFADNDDGSDRLELYNLKDDIGETKNLAGEQPTLASELNALVGEFLARTEAVIPVRNPNFVLSGELLEAADPLRGWKARSCEATVKDGVVTIVGKGPTPFLGNGLGPFPGPAKVTLRVRAANGGAGKFEWLLPSAADKSPHSQSTPFTLLPGDWQEAVVEAPVESLPGIVRIYLPAQQQPVEIDWIEVEHGARHKRWDF